MVVERGNERARLDFADEVNWSIGVCLSAGKEARSGGCGWREGLLWVYI
jgi:hypothetical protein